MIRSIQQLYGFRLNASDGEIGRIKDFYFDDEHWAIRYVVVDTGEWIAGRLVLLSPHAFHKLHEDEISLEVGLTRQQIKESPSLESHKPISRQYEEEYFRHYGWPTYWDSGGMWAQGGFPAAPPPPDALPAESLPPLQSGSHDEDARLRSTQSLAGYHIENSGSDIGHLKDFLVGTKSWKIRGMMVQTGHWFSSREIVVRTECVQRISYEESTVSVHLTKEAILKAPEMHAPGSWLQFSPLSALTPAHHESGNPTGNGS